MQERLQVLEQRRALVLVARQVGERDAVGCADADELPVEPAQHAMDGEVAGRIGRVERGERRGVGEPGAIGCERVDECHGSRRHRIACAGRQWRARQRALEAVALQEATGVVVGQRAEARQLSAGQGDPWVISLETRACCRGERSVGGDDREGDRGGDVELVSHRGACRVGGQQLAVGVLR